jgi:heat shock protein HslJ
MNMRRTTLAVIAAAALPLALALSGCGTETADDGVASGGATGNDAERIPGEWIPESLTLDGHTYSLPETERTADALVVIDPGRTADDGGRSGVYVGCNSTGTDMRIEGDTIYASPFVSTLMGCGEELNRFEQGAVAIFESDPTFELSDSGDPLTLTLTRDNGDSMTLTRGEERPITGIRWAPESVSVEGETMARPAGSDGAYLEIEPASSPENGGDAEFHSGCNHLSATVVIEWRALTVSSMGATEMGCPGPMMEFEERVFGVFTDNPAFALDPSGDTLTLTTDDGDSMILMRDDAR